MGRRRTPLSCELQQLSAQMRLLARVQGGVLSAAECRVIGVDKASVRRLLDAGEWLAVRRGTYRDPRFHPPVPAVAEFHRRCAALLAALSGPAVISHVSAARLLRLPLPPGPPAGRISITRRPPASFNDPLGGDVHVRDYMESDVRRIGGVPLLGGARLVLDCCAVLPPDSALAVADACLRRKMTTPDGLRDAAEQ
ncbi:MAG: type IV toxin-antitoxin system AbiEi family antitoxin domain-containing protein, partial [Pseudonocardia sp.]|nr:type IV toxin-antitoxin system AbiEi family antitoxin domain-containing protein [Pseudonocardia sp.]